MTRLIVTTSQREAPLTSASGWLYIIDLNDQKILQITEGMEPPNRADDHNPRGGMRGMRGMSFHKGELAMAGYSSVFFFDRHWKLLRIFTHPSISAIHEILYVEDGILVTSTANDLLAKFDLSGKLQDFHYLRAQKNLMVEVRGPQRQLLQPRDIIEGRMDFRSRSYFKSDLYDRTHLNGITLSGDGRLFLSLGLIVGETFGLLMNVKTLLRRIRLWNFFLAGNRLVRRLLGLHKKMLSDLVIQPASGRSAVVTLDPQGQWRVHLQFPILQNPSHSIRMLEDGTALYLATSKGSLVHFNKDGTILSETQITDKFLRGLLILPNQQLVIGAGHTLLLFDFPAKKILSEIELSSDPLNTVFDVQIFPPDFDLPPDSLNATVGRITGYAGQDVIWQK